MATLPTYRIYQIKSPILTCPRCKGKYIKTREGQKECVACIRREERKTESKLYTNRYYEKQL